jgi:peptidoglycan/LPS O-acetylase OafA/YrhL
MLHGRMDMLMMGCLLALWYESQALDRVERFFRPWLVALLAFLGIFGSRYLAARFAGRYLYCVGYTIEALSIAFLIYWVVRRPNTVVGQILNSKVAVEVGTLSYGLYLWQELFFHSSKAGIFGKTPLNLICALAFASASYYFVEKHFLAMRKGFISKQLVRVVTA